MTATEGWEIFAGFWRLAEAVEGYLQGMKTSWTCQEKCKPEDKFGRHFITLCGVGACSAPV